MTGETDRPAAAESGRGEGFPWPPVPSRPILEAGFETWRRSVLSPADFFRRMPVRGGIGSPLLYYLVVGIVVAAISLFWRSVHLAAFGPGDGMLYRMLGRSAQPGALLLLDFLLSPLYLLIALFVAAGAIHLVLLVVGGAREGFEATTRVLAFAYGPMLFSIIPAAGQIVGSIWTVVVAIIGLREAHRIEGWRATVAVLLPIVLLFALAMIATILALTIGGLLSTVAPGA